MSTTIDQFDHYLTPTGPAALVIREYLIPVEGSDAICFPPTFAPSEKGKPSRYNIDPHPDGDIALVDTVGSQANRMEPMFAEPEYASLVPQVIITAGTKRISLLDAGHRAGDAIVRCSSLQEELNSAFKMVQDGDDTALAKIAPTSLVFGVWDSRDTQAKRTRLIASTIRAFDVRELKRSAQYNPAFEYVKSGILEEAKDNTTEKAYAERGFIHVPATGSHGGIIAKGGIRRDATLGIAALKLINAGSDAEATRKLRRYILGLALVAFTRLPGGYLRQGTILVSDPDKERKAEEVYHDGKRNPFTVTHEQALAYATAAAAAFVVGESREVPFDAERAKKDLEGKAGKKAAKKAATKKAKGADENEDETTPDGENE
jgi:CRISPR-associated protein Csb1